ncbi:MAG: MerR family transcriptional regulator [Bacteroidetes bacterium]|nr:MerR family transcriptional regulator [Bacteroidota bacterium]MBS1931709.1 MerR family transcriptional regulator [Bacteroidota bacterium]
MNEITDHILVPDDEVLFKKQYYAIGEVAAMFRVNQSLIRYWETEFDILKPKKNRKGDRFFRPVDVKNLVLIHDLLRRRKFTIEGAKEYLKKNKNAEEKFAVIQSLENLKSFLLQLKTEL